MTSEVLTGERARLDPGDLIGPRPRAPCEVSRSVSRAICAERATRS